MAMSEIQLAEKRQRGLLGSSSAAALWDYYQPGPERVDLFSNAASVYDDIVLGKEKKVSDVMLEGTLVEDAVLTWFEEHKGPQILGGPVVLYRGSMEVHSNGIMCANFDGIGFFTTETTAKTPIVVEAKWRRARTREDSPCDRYGRSGSMEVPLRVFLQVQHQLAVAGPEYQMGYVAVLRGDLGFGYFKVPRDNDIIRQVEENAVRFHENHIRPRIPPALPDLVRAEAEGVLAA